MAGNKYVLDTNIVVAILNQEPALETRLTGKTVFVPTVVLGELYFGAYKSGRVAENLARLEIFIVQHALLGCDKATAEQYGKIKQALVAKGRLIPENDIWIAAVAPAAQPEPGHARPAFQRGRRFIGRDVVTRRLLPACCLLALLILAAPLAAQSGDVLPAPHLGYGIHVGPNLDASADMIRALGMDWVKVYDVPQVGDYTAFRVLFRMDLDWPTDWDYFRQDVTRRARELVALGVDAIEVHNEPNLSMEWPRGPNAWEYVQVLRVAYEAIKAIAPEVIVVSGGLAPTLTTADRRAINDLDFAREMLDNGAGAYFDAFGYHPYGFDQPPEADPTAHELTFRRAERIRALLESYGLGDRPIWLTEFGWLRDPAEDGVNCQDDPALAGFEWMRLPGTTQADYTVRAFAYADRYWPWAGPVFLWNLNWQLYSTAVEPACSHLRWFSLLDGDGTPTETYRAVAAMSRRVSAYRPRLEARSVLLPGQMLAAEDTPIYPVAAFCPNAVAAGEFEIVNTGWPAQVTISVEPAALAAPGTPLVAVSAAQARFGDRVIVYADVSDTPPGQYLVAINLRAAFEGRPLSGNARLLLQVENTPINCP